MRGKPQAQPDFLTVVNLNNWVPADPPWRALKRHPDAIRKKLSPLCDELYEELGRPSIPPEQLLKARVLTALYPIRSERLFYEQLGYHLLWLWFLDREFSAGRFDRSVFAKNSERVLSADVAKLFFARGYDLSRQEGWTSDAHFTADGTLIKSWASLKSFVRKDGADAPKVQSAKDQDPGNPSMNFRGEKRCNDPHQSTTGKSGSQTSQRIRKRVEEILGWIKTGGGLRRIRYRGRERTQAWGYFVAGTYHLLRMARLERTGAN
jgi:transposase